MKLAGTGDSGPVGLRSPLRLRSGVTLKNRIIKAAMTEKLADPESNEPNEHHVELYARWAHESNAAALITGNIMVDGEYMESPYNVLLEGTQARIDHYFKVPRVSERVRAILADWSSAAQCNGCTLWAQVSHAGRQSPKAVTHRPIGPSDNPPVNPLSSPEALCLFSSSRAMTLEEITDALVRFTSTALLVKQAGFSGVQVHAAHGYLLSQFLSPLTNRRVDDYGGNAVNRRRLLIDVVRSIRGACGPTFGLSVKLNSADFQKGGLEVDEAIDVALALEAEGIDFLELSGGNYERPELLQKPNPREAYFMDLALKFRARLKSCPIMLTGGFRDRSLMEEVLVKRQVDLIGIGRPFCTQHMRIAALLTGACERLDEPNVRVGWKPLDAGLVASWHVGQIHRLAQGQDPDPRLGVLYWISIDLVLNYIFNPRRVMPLRMWRTLGAFLLVMLLPLMLNSWRLFYVKP
jgi:2,4-dienoyl-CoA reductase-like NADH-dependent reductase (Old Yellow Enzyme family)